MLVITSDWVEFVVVNVIVVLETLITAWLRIVIATCWLGTRVPLSVSEIVISALMNPAGARVMSGVTVITAVQRFCQGVQCPVSAKQAQKPTRLHLQQPPS